MTAWQTVPVDATRAMIDAAQKVEEEGYDAMHKAMLAAAPAFPEITGRVPVELSVDEHYALTALLRSGVSIHVLDRLGLLDLCQRLNAPYKHEVEARQREALAFCDTQELSRVTPGLVLNQTLAWACQDIERLPAAWYRWHGNLNPLNSDPTEKADL